MSGFEPRFLEFATEYLVRAGRYLIEQGLVERVSEESLEESDEVRGLRKEYGHKLLAKDADIEALTAELNEVIQQRDNLQAQLRKVTRTVQRAWDAHNILREALYGVVR